MTNHEPHAAAIARELEALGEDPPSAEELAMLAAAALDDEPDVARTTRLIELAQVDTAHDEPLGELGKQRVWRAVESRRAIGRARLSGRWVAVGLAIAAALAVLVLVPGRDESREPGPSAAEVGEVGDQARLALQALDDGLDDTARLEQLRGRYAERMEAQP
jgi:hypothetical protein